MVRIGTGYDVHRLVPERKLILCGVEDPANLDFSVTRTRTSRCTP